jgi:hypothetical protein
LSKEEFEKFAVGLIKSVTDQNLDQEEFPLVNSMFEKSGILLNDQAGLNLEQFRAWFNEEQTCQILIERIKHLTHIRLGLLPIHVNEEKLIIKNLIEKNSELQLGNTHYILATKWWNAWKDFCQFDSVESSNSPRKRVGPIDNSSIYFKQTLKLKPRLTDQDFIILPAPAWTAIWNWYGGGPSFARCVIQEGDRLQVELYPFHLILQLRRSVLTTAPAKQLEHCISKTATLQTLKEEGCEKMMVSDLSRIRMWDFSKASKPVLYEDLSLSLSVAKVSDGHRIVFEMKNDDEIWPLSASIDTTQTSLPGLVGLHNLGNTCFMNSAVQCLSNTKFLTQYFLHNHYRYELNTTNPIGPGGNIAKKYAELIQKIWIPDQQGKVVATFAPRSFKRVVGRYNSIFADGKQHDAQELLMFLLNGLHEDLNRIKGRLPYVPNPEGDFPDDEKAKLFWEAHKKRNHSIVVDLFQGQLRSCLTCQECSYSSVTFEPFTFLQIPLPMDKNRLFFVFYRPLNGSLPGVKYGILVPSIGTMGDVKQELCHLTGIPYKQLLIAETQGHSIAKYLPGNSKLTNVQTNTLYAFHVNISKNQLLEDLNPEVALSEGLLDESLNARPKRSREKFVNVSVVLRYLQPLSVYHLFPFKISLFGAPFVVSINIKTATLEELYELIAFQLGPVVKCNQNQLRDLGIHSDYPFTIHICSRNGDGCGKCSWHLFCLGCPLTQDDLPKLTSESSLALDWHPKLLSSYDASLAQV